MQGVDPKSKDKNLKKTKIWKTQKKNVPGDHDDNSLNSEDENEVFCDPEMIPSGSSKPVVKTSEMLDFETFMEGLQKNLKKSDKPRKEGESDTESSDGLGQTLEEQKSKDKIKKKKGKALKDRKDIKEIPKK